MDSTEYVNRLFNLSGHIGIVTGASRGLGLGTARVLAQSGAKVYNFDKIPREMEEMSVDNIVDIEVDLTQPDKVKDMVGKIVRLEGHLDFLINNAGITIKCRAEDFPSEDYQKIQLINLEAVLELCKICYPYLKKSPFIGRIINISSMAAHMGFTEVVPYCMTKSGIIGLTRGLAEEWKKEPILVNSVAPGWFLTKLNVSMFEKNPNRKQAALGKIALGRFGEPKEIGYMMLFLLSGASVYLTGQDFAVDGGALIHGF